MTPGLSGLELRAGVAALSGLIVVRFYFLPGKTKETQCRMRLRSGHLVRLSAQRETSSRAIPSGRHERTSSAGGQDVRAPHSSLHAKTSLVAHLLPDGLRNSGNHTFAGRFICRRVRNEDSDGQVASIRQGNDSDVIGRGRHSFFSS